MIDMPATPLNVVGTPGGDYFSLSWQRPPDATIVGYRVSWGSKSGIYDNFVDVGDSTSYTISPLPFNENTYIIVQSFDGGLPVTFSVPSIELTRLFPVTGAGVLVVVPDPLAPSGGVNQLYWTNPLDPNVQGQKVFRALGGTSTSAASPGLATVGGELLFLDINGDGVQAISLGANATPAAVAADIQAQVRATFPFNPVRQVAYSSFKAVYEAGRYKLISAAIGGGPNSVVVQPSAAATILKLGLADGGVETLGTDGVFIDNALVPQSQYRDVVSVNDTEFAYAVISYDYSEPFRLAITYPQTQVRSQKLLGSAPPSAPRNLKGEDNAISVVLEWGGNLEVNVASYEVRYALSMADLIGSPTVVNVGLATGYVVAGFTALDDVYAQVYAIDNGLNPDGSSRAPYYSQGSNIFERFVTGAGFKTQFVIQEDGGNDTILVWNNLPMVDHFHVEIDSVPTFDSPNLAFLQRFMRVEDLVLIGLSQSFPMRRSVPVKWYWRVKPIYPGDVEGVWGTQTRERLVLHGFKSERIAAKFDNVPLNAVFIPSRLIVKAGATVYDQGSDYDFIAPNKIVRTTGSAIPDGAEVEVDAEFEQYLVVQRSRKSQARDIMHQTLDGRYYDKSARTTNIFKWFDSISKGAMGDYLSSDRIMAQGRFISTTVPSELYSRYGGMVGLNFNEVPQPDAYAAIKAMYAAMMDGGTMQAIDLACRGLTGNGCDIEQFGTGAGSGWILHGNDGPPAGFGDFLFEDFPDTLPYNHHIITLSDYDDEFNYRITIKNSARGVVKTVLRDGRVGDTDFIGVRNIVPGSLRIMADEGFGPQLVDTSRYLVDNTEGTVKWIVPVADGITYVVICGVYIVDLIKRMFNLILPAHVNPIYVFQVQNLAQTLGLMVWEASIWDMMGWAN